MTGLAADGFLELEFARLGATIASTGKLPTKYIKY